MLLQLYKYLTRGCIYIQLSQEKSTQQPHEPRQPQGYKGEMDLDQIDSVHAKPSYGPWL